MHELTREVYLSIFFLQDGRQLSDLAHAWPIVPPSCLSIFTILSRLRDLLTTFFWELYEMIMF